MNLPVQAPPTARNTTQFFGLQGIDPSNLACDLCCKLSPGKGACSFIPGCSCPI